jgi:hypothetical protein
MSTRSKPARRQSRLASRSPGFDRGAALRGHARVAPLRTSHGHALADLLLGRWRARMRPDDFISISETGPMRARPVAGTLELAGFTTIAWTEDFGPGGTSGTCRGSTPQLSTRRRPVTPGISATAALHHWRPGSSPNPPATSCECGGKSAAASSWTSSRATDPRAAEGTVHQMRAKGRRSTRSSAAGPARSRFRTVRRTGRCLHLPPADGCVRSSRARRACEPRGSFRGTLSVRRGRATGPGDRAQDGEGRTMQPRLTEQRIQTAAITARRPRP